MLLVVVRFHRLMTILNSNWNSICSIHILYRIGHYVATVKDVSSLGDFKPQRWYCFNDEEVESIAECDLVASPSAYLLFYMRR